MARVLSIEVGKYNTKILDINYSNKKVYGCWEVDTPKGAVEDGYLESNALDDVALEIQKVLTQNRVKTNKICFTVFSSKIISRESLIPTVKKNQIKNMINMNLDDYLPIDKNEFNVSYILSNSYNENTKNKTKVTIVAAELKLIEAYIDLAKKLNCELIDIDYVGNSIYQIANEFTNKKRKLVLKIERDYLIASVVSDGNLLMQRGLVGEYSFEDEKKNIQIVNAIERIISVYMEQNSNNAIEEIVLVGFDKANPHITDVIANSIQIPCYILDNVDSFHLSKNIKKDDFYKYIALVGSAKESIGLLDDNSKSTDGNNYLIASVVLGIISLAITGIMLSSSIMTYYQAKNKDISLTNSLAQYASAEQTFEKYNTIISQYKQIKAGFEFLENRNDNILTTLDKLEEITPKNAVITEFLTDKKSCKISMRVANKEIAAGVIKSIREELDGIKEISVNDMIEDNSVVFSIICDYKPVTQIDLPEELINEMRCDNMQLIGE